ncbi:NAD(P)/FAD-dependent oxidoreductase [Rhodosalinus sp. FB01]|uniref:NAD(P)/FAD-dependent oxidoreductase n=1 Tax=Rhodosalinus sp. FB01 TaxID=3239194 RepID=UPI003523CFE8
MTDQSDHDVIVIGAGVIGVSIAIALQAAGRDVLLVDRSAPGNGASFANAGAFAFSDIVPLATPGIIRAAPRWLADPLGPLSVDPSYVFAIAPWLLRFWRASWKDRFPRLMEAQAALMELSRAALERQVADTSGEHLLQREGQLRVYQGARRFERSRSYWDACRQYGIRFDLLESPAEIAELQPGLSSEFTHAGYTPDWINTRDPMLWLEHLLSVFRARGGVVDRLDARALQAGDERITLHGAEVTLSAGHVIVAAGAWSRTLAMSLGDRIPLETERGYNTTIRQAGFDLRTHITFADHGFVASRIQDGVRVGGAVELAGLVRPPNFKRAKILRDKASAFMPGLDASRGREWMGFRPSLPDSLPVIGHAQRTDRVVYAFAHGHLGLTQAAGTAELVQALICGVTPPLDAAPFSARRFT